MLLDTKPMAFAILTSTGVRMARWFSSGVLYRGQNNPSMEGGYQFRTYCCTRSIAKGWR